MKNIWKSLMAIMGVTVLSIHGSMAQDSGALIDALVKKGVLTDQEGEEIRSETAKDWAQTSASKINISSFIKNITLYGDMRLRFEDREGITGVGDSNASGGPGPGSASVSQEKDRWRYRLRVGVKGDLYDSFFYGVRLNSGGSNQRSGNISFGNSGGAKDGGNTAFGSTGDAANGGPFAHNNGFGFDLLYVGVKPADWVTLTMGQIANPFYTTNMIWDDNLNPTGFSEQFSHKVIDDDTEVFANFGQFLYDSFQTSSSTASSSVGGNNNFMLEEQIGIKHKFTDDIYYKGAVGVMTYTGYGEETGTTVDAGTLGNWGGAGNQPIHFNGVFTGFNANSNSYSVNNLAVLETPFEVGFKIQKDWIPMKLFGDFAYNLSGRDRAQAAQDALVNGGPGGLTEAGGQATAVNGTTSTTAQAATAATISSTPYQGVLTDAGRNDVKAYQIGMQFNELKKKNDWMAKVYWNHTEYFAVDPNLIDADIFDARTNMEGIVFKASYMLTNDITLTGQFADANRIDKNLSTPGTGEDLTNPPNHYQLVQADLIWKF